MSIVKHFPTYCVNHPNVPNIFECRIVINISQRRIVTNIFQHRIVMNIPTVPL
jgi:hypothetical protein